MKKRQCVTCNKFFIQRLNNELRCSKECELKFQERMKEKSRVFEKVMNSSDRHRFISKVVRKRRKQGTKKKSLFTGFYGTDEWLKLRYQVIKYYGRKCMACFAVDRPMHVDHIIPRSKRPDLELEFTNLQVLCGPCNKGKSDVDDTDWRIQKTK